MVIVSILMQSSNQKCNAFQSVLGIFLHSCHTPERVVKTFAHLGISVSPSSIQRAIHSLSARSEESIRELVQTLTAALAYDNFDIDFPTNTPTVEGTSDTLTHLTSGLWFKLQHGITAEDLRCSEQLWRHSKYNENATIRDAIHSVKQLTLRLIQLYPDDEAVERTGLSRAGRFNAWKFRYDLIHSGPERLHRYKSKLSKPEDVEKIPVTKLEYVPARSVDCNQSRVSENANALRDFYAEAGIGDPLDETDWHRLVPDVPVDVSEHVQLIFGDLGVWAKLNALRERRGIERTPWRRFQFIVFVFGLFHLKMAAAESLWKILIKPKGAEKDSNSLRTLAGLLRPRETGKIASKPGFRRIHEIIQHAGIVLRLDAWTQKIRQHNPAWKSLEQFAASNPPWELIETMSNELATECVAGEDVTKPNLYMVRQRAKPERDQEHENVLLTHQYLLKYEELSYSMNVGDIGRFDSNLPFWIYFFKGSGKPNYANAALQYLNDVLFVYPEKLR